MVLNHRLRILSRHTQITCDILLMAPAVVRTSLEALRMESAAAVGVLEDWVTYLPQDETAQATVKALNRGPQLVVVGGEEWVMEAERREQGADEVEARLVDVGEEAPL